MGDPKFVKAFLTANYTGFYLKVLSEGYIEAGQTIEKTGGDGYGLTVEEVSYLYALDKSNRQLLEKAANAPNLPDDWKELYVERLHKLTGNRNA